jgi:hypothetical protein
MLRVYRVLLALGCLALLAGCDPPNPNANTPTSGRLILFVDEMYAPLVESLRDTFALLSPNARIEVHAVPARMAIEELLRADATIAERRDTTASVAVVIGRKLLADEESAARATGKELGTYVIGYDGLVAAVATGSPMRQTTLERLRNALKSPPGYPLALDSGGSAGTTQFLVPNQNSSTFMIVRRELLQDSNIVAPVRYFATSDSVAERAAAGDGIALLGWYRAHRDSTRLRPLLIGHNDSLGRFISPVRVHPSTLVTGTYPLRQPIVGYSLAPVNSLANGFLTWLARGQTAQYFLVYQGLQPENVRITLTVPDDGTE